MNLFKIFSKKENKKEDIKPIEAIDTKEISVKDLELCEEKFVFDSKEDRIEHLKENCEHMIEASKQIEEAKVEYQAVTSYLTDIQRIEAIEDTSKSTIDEDARQIITLTKERAKYQKNGKIKITDKQYKNMQKNEENILKDIKKVTDNEHYNSLIKSDMRHLEGEKGALLYEKDEIMSQQKYLKNMARMTSVIVLAMFLLFLVIANIFDKDMIIPYMLTVLLAAVGGGYIFIEARKNMYSIKMVEKKFNRAINLLNTVKIKYVNNTNALEYEYSKFNVNSAMELQYIWEQYLKAREEERKYKDNTDNLNFYNNELVTKLRQFEIKDPDIWIYQAVALIDSKEMVEIRHRLNVRRQKLRERIDYNNTLRDKEKEEIIKLLKEKKVLKEDFTNVLKEYNIVIGIN